MKKLTITMISLMIFSSSLILAEEKKSKPERRYFDIVGSVSFGYLFTNTLSDNYDKEADYLKSNNSNITDEYEYNNIIAGFALESRFYFIQNIALGLSIGFQYTGDHISYEDAGGTSHFDSTLYYFIPAVLSFHYSIPLMSSDNYLSLLTTTIIPSNG